MISNRSHPLHRSSTPFRFRCRDVFFAKTPSIYFRPNPRSSTSLSSPAGRRGPFGALLRLAAALSPLPSPPHLLSRRRALLPHLRWPRRAPLLLPAATEFKLRPLSSSRRRIPSMRGLHRRQAPGAGGRELQGRPHPLSLPDPPRKARLARACSAPCPRCYGGRRSTPASASRYSTPAQA